MQKVKKKSVDKALGVGVIMSEDAFVFKFSFAAFNKTTENDEVLIDKMITPMKKKDNHNIMLEFTNPAILSAKIP